MPGAPSAKAPATRRSRIGWTAVILSSLLIVTFSLSPYVQSSLRTLAAEGGELAGVYADAPAMVQAAFYAHVASASIALALGLWQFSHRLRRRLPAAHRNVGRVYLGSVALGSVSSLVILPFNSAGMAGFFGFGTLAVLWAYSALRAYRAIRGGEVAHHQAWMIRNYAFTYAATTLRAWLSILIMVQGPFAGAGADPGALFANAYAVVPFLCWLPNVVVAEWLIRRRGLPSYRLAAPAAPPAPATV